MFRFQSLFLWNSRPDRNQPAELHVAARGFNPCFCGTRARTRERIVQKVGCHGFQSLFLWNSRPDPWPVSYAIKICRVSILVFVELAPGRGVVSSTGTAARCFNPCFCGTRARTISSLSHITTLLQFQSLFLWNSRPDPEGLSTTIELNRFQSLFLWNSRPDILQTRSRLSLKIVSILVFVELAPGLTEHGFERT